MNKIIIVALALMFAFVPLSQAEIMMFEEKEVIEANDEVVKVRIHFIEFNTETGERDEAGFVDTDYSRAQVEAGALDTIWIKDNDV